MAIIVPALRLVLLFLNVFETFKTLKPPRRSVRTGEQTPRALSQRKRDMKGCMAIWLLWCTCSVVEGITDSTVGIVMPFYSEIKAIIYLFQILTRARGAEPIYLHVMRPLLKPYIATLDYAFEFVNMLGDFVALLISIPIGYVTSWWNPAPTAFIEVSPGLEPEPEWREKPSRQSSNGSAVGVRTRGMRQPSDGAGASERNAAGPSRTARPNGYPQSRSESTFNQQKHKIWRPPVDAHDQDYDERPRPNRRIVSDSATAPLAASADPSIAPNERDEPTTAAGEVEEWRQYPPFPSAYPSTPQVMQMPIPSISNTQPQPNMRAIYEMPQPQFHPDALPQHPRERPMKPRAPAPVSQSLPSRGGRRGRLAPEEAINGQDFGLSPERLRVSPT